MECAVTKGTSISRSPKTQGPSWKNGEKIIRGDIVEKHGESVSSGQDETVADMITWPRCVQD